MCKQGFEKELKYKAIGIATDGESSYLMVLTTCQALFSALLINLRWEQVFLFYK